MLPRLAGDDAMNLSSTNAVVGGQISHATAIGGLGSNRKHLRGNQRGLPMTFTLRTMNTVVTALLLHVFIVGVASAKEQMRWIHAWRIIASVTHTEAAWNGTKVQNPRYTMGGRSTASVASSVDDAISEVSRGAGPQPTRRRLLDVLPEALLQRHANINTGHTPIVFAWALYGNA